MRRVFEGRNDEEGGSDMKISVDEEGGILLEDVLGDKK